MTLNMGFYSWPITEWHHDLHFEHNDLHFKCDLHFQHHDLHFEHHDRHFQNHDLYVLNIMTCIFKTDSSNIMTYFFNIMTYVHQTRRSNCFSRDKAQSGPTWELEYFSSWYDLMPRGLRPDDYCSQSPNMIPLFKSVVKADRVALFIKKRLNRCHHVKLPP